MGKSDEQLRRDNAMGPHRDRWAIEDEIVRIRRQSECRIWQTRQGENGQRLRGDSPSVNIVFTIGGMTEPLPGVSESA